jgi:hypothetical protein
MSLKNCTIKINFKEANYILKDELALLDLNMLICHIINGG